MVAISLALVALIGLSSAQTYQRLGACPKLGCVFPPDLSVFHHLIRIFIKPRRTDFLAGQYFDIRLEVHAPVNGSEANGGIPDPNFRFTIQKKGATAAQNASQYFRVSEPALERWNFTWFEDLFAKDAFKPSLVQVTAKAYRRIALYEPGEYTATLTYYNGSTTVANWLVRDLATVRKTKNVLLFIGDGMTTAMISAARHLAHKSTNGRFHSKMAMDQFPVLGHSMTHSIDSFITDSANSAMALYTGHKSTVNCLGVYADSSRTPFDDPKVESIAEIFRRVWSGGIGIVSTAFLADATPAALTAHTRDRGQYGAVIDSFLNGITNYTWTNWTGPDVLLGGGAENFLPGSGSYQGKDYYAAFASKGYAVVQNNTALQALSNTSKTLGVFSVSNMAKIVDRVFYPENLKNITLSPDGKRNPTLDQPGLKEMTLKALDILNARSKQKGWLMMSEAASIDKQMHLLDYDRALGELLELDETVRASIEKLRQLGELNNTLIIVTADHGHGFDVMGSTDTKYLNEAQGARKKRNAIGTYQNSGLSQYVIPSNSSLKFSEGTHYPANWSPRYTFFSGLGANPDHREDYQIRRTGPRLPAINFTSPATDFYVNYVDAPTGFVVNGTLPVIDDQGVHSLQDVPVFTRGPCQELFSGVYNNIEIFFNIANCLGVGRPNNATLA
ncbi:MAG: hypothetical protein M1814_002863 [Vezdaea aestivalis]|nr:MAG: hypothetical protein M1814_002863 [Vezdaea aestivalis]